MPLASLQQIEKTFGKRVIFDKLDFQIDRGERVGLIGDNGAGKTTIFRALTREMVPDAGVVSVSKSTTIGHLQQEQIFDPTNTVIDEAELAFAELHRLSHRMRDLEHEMEHLTDDALQKILDEYQEVQHDFDLAGGYAFQHRLEATLLGVGLPKEVWEQNVNTLSGGQRSRLALVKILIAEPDLLLLDEPTNHLDLAAIEWLEEYLLDFKGAVLLISHDRFLLDRLATRIIWLTQCKLKSYPGNYSAFQQQKELAELSQTRAREQQQADIEKQAEYIRRFKAGQRATQAKGRERRLTRLLASDQVIAEVARTKKINLSINTDQRAGDKVLDVRELSKSYDDKQLWQDIQFEVKRGERIGIIGPNGSGKTTLLEVLLGRRDADGGKIKWGANLNVGYYDQRQDDFDPESTVLETAAEDSDAKEQELRDALGSMLFRGDDIYKPVNVLSGGERARLRLVQLLLDQPNVLLLDEPTNHLDIASCEALEKALAGFPGTILTVSHDRYFLDRSVKRMLILDPPGLRDFDGGYTAWVKKHTDEVAEAKRIATAAKQKPPQKKVEPPKPAPQKSQQAKKDNPYSRPFGRLTVQELEKEIARTDADLKKCQSRFADMNQFKDATKGKQLQDEHDTLAAKLKALEAEYFLREQ